MTPQSSHRTGSFANLARRFIAIAALTGLTMCNIDHVDVDAGGKASIPHATLIDTLLGSVAFAGFDKVDFTAEFQNQGVTKDQVDAVRLKSFKLDIDAPADGSFDFLESVTFFAEADGLDKVQIASMASIPKGRTELDLTVDAGVDLAPFVVAPSMRITSEIQGSRPDADTTVSAAVVLDVDVHIPGCG